MKAKLTLKFVIIVILPIVISILSSAQTKPQADNAPTTPARADDSQVPDAGINVPAVPPSPEQLLLEYQAAMMSITQNFSANLSGITEAVQQGKMSSVEGKISSIAQYLIAQMQFQLLSAWHQIDEQDLPKVPAADDKSEASPNDGNDIVLVEMPFSSFELTAAMAGDLGLTQSQEKAIQRVMTRERDRIEPLIAQLRSIREKLLALDPQLSNKKEIKTLADAEAGLLAKLIVANARMESEIYKLLPPEQQRKLDDLKRNDASGTVASR